MRLKQSYSQVTSKRHLILSKHTFIFAALQSFGFGPDFIQWVKTFLYKAESCVMNNGSSTGYFYLERGSRQGDPISTYPFILAIKILLIRTRDNHHIKGIMIDGQEIKLSHMQLMGNFIKAVTSCSTHKIDQQETDG